MSTHELATKLAVFKVLSDLIKTQVDDTKAAVTESMEPGDRVTAKLQDGTKIASVTLTDPSARAKVVDEAAFTKWVEANAPSEVVATVRESYRKQLLDAVKSRGAPVTENGEEIPGVDVTTTDPYPSVRAASGAQEAIAKAWRDGTVQLGALPELE